MNYFRKIQILALVLAISFASFAGYNRFNPAQPADASFLGVHAINFHGCSNWISYTATSYSTGVISQSTLDYYFDQAFGYGGGWDSQCGDKVYWDPSFVIAPAYVGPQSWVDTYCTPGAGGCVRFNAGNFVTGHEYMPDVILRDTLVSSLPYYVINHEYGHVLAMGDIEDCGYDGVMYQLPFEGSPCSTVINWPSYNELVENANYITNPGTY